MSASDSQECPSCRSAAQVRHKRILVDPAAPATMDVREKYYGPIRVDDLGASVGGASPLEQFVDGYFCDACGRGFLGDDQTGPIARRPS
jgi:hypothetical protein